ncbi:MAG TPA: hypothetical protein VJR89_41745 [Polyangiales bacterium]|nr:hypothetical protein [Polyangiales bacterium]
MTRHRSKSLLAVLGLCAACAGGTSEPPPKHPKATGPMCDYVALENDESPGPQPDNLDALSLVAVFRLSEPNLPPPKHPIEAKFLVQRSRADELRARLEAHPEVICTPDQNRYRPELTGYDQFGLLQP